MCVCLLDSLSWISIHSIEVARIHVNVHCQLKFISTLSGYFGSRHILLRTHVIVVHSIFESDIAAAAPIGSLLPMAIQ